MANNDGKSALFVCLGNICRSPMAEGILNHLVNQRTDRESWEIDSCGTIGYHTGKQPDERCLDTLKKHGIIDFTHKARMLRKSDFSKFQWIFVFDIANKSDVESMKPASTTNSKVVLLRNYDPEKDCDQPIVIDPYYDEDSYFELCYQQCWSSLKSFLEKEFP